MTNGEMEEAIVELTEIAQLMRDEIRRLRARVDYLDRYAKLKRVTMVEAIGDAFSYSLKATRGG